MTESKCRMVEPPVVYDDKLSRPSGVSGFTTSWCERFKWEPGNGTKYELFYGRRTIGGERSEDEQPEENNTDYILMYLCPFTVRWKAMSGKTEWYINHRDVIEHLDVNEADAVGILMFLERFGHYVGYPQPQPVQ